MFRATIVALGILFGVFSASPANAYRFGNSEDINFIQDVGVTGPKGEKLFLAYKTSTFNFVAGANITDDGYVLGVKGDSKRYFHMPTGAEFDRLQASGLLPKPLPPYKLSFFDYLMGYLLWVITLIIGLWYLVAWLRKRGKPADPEAPAPAA
jgi:hypothetical protein